MGETRWPFNRHPVHKRELDPNHVEFARSKTEARTRPDTTTHGFTVGVSVKTCRSLKSYCISYEEEMLNRISYR